MQNKIKSERKRLGISQEQLAKQCEVTRQTMNAIENDKYDPSLSLAFKLSKNVNISIEDLFEYDGRD